MGDQCPPSASFRRCIEPMAGSFSRRLGRPEWTRFEGSMEVGLRQGWTAWWFSWNMTCIFGEILGMEQSSQLTFIFFRGFFLNHQPVNVVQPNRCNPRDIPTLWGLLRWRFSHWSLRIPVGIFSIASTCWHFVGIMNDARWKEPGMHWSGSGWQDRRFDSRPDSRLDSRYAWHEDVWRCMMMYDGVWRCMRMLRWCTTMLRWCTTMYEDGWRWMTMNAAAVVADDDDDDDDYYYYY